MDTKIFLEGFRSKKSVNTSEGLNVQFKGRRNLLPLNDIGEVISQYDQYVEERDKCNIIRLTCQVNPICSNVLFNKISEIVKNEGSSGVSYINYSVMGKKRDGSDYSNEELFNGVLYKRKRMDFWSSNELNYQNEDTNVSQDSNKKIADVIGMTSCKKHLTNGSLGKATVTHPTNAIRDMQLSNSTTNFVYHCGLDILNNHLIRSKTFKTVCKMPNLSNYNPTSYNDDYGAFNTIADLMRDVKGDKVVEKIYFPEAVSVDNHARMLALHLYEYDDIYSFEETVKNKLIEKYNGWVGFDNKSKIKSYLTFNNDTEMEIERPLMYMNGGDFVDMYPSRDLYSFVPKYNHFRQRVEKNWNYCITYPSSSYTPSDSSSPFGDVIESNDGINSLKAVYFDENTRSDNGTSQLVIYSVARHGLAVGDYVNIYKTYKDGNKDVTVKVIDNGEVSAIADDYVFTVFNADTQLSTCWVELTDLERKVSTTPLTIDGKQYTLDSATKKYFIGGDSNFKYYIVNDRYVNFDDSAQRISYKKVVNDIECEYYIRIFSRLPNFKYASGDTSNEYQIYRKDMALNSQNMVEIYQDKRYEFENHISRLAFAKNIYTDEVGQVVFTDDLDISNLKDNLGRPLTSLYMTFVKNNKGYKEWYGYDYADGAWNVNEIGDVNVEFSHCFGKVTCGIEASYESSFDDSIKSVRRINNVDTTIIGYEVGGIISNKDRKYTTESGKEVKITNQEVWFDTDKHYYGDLSYYDNYNAVERHIDYVMHRFNTAQRESYRSASKDYYKNYLYDNILIDDYDTSEKYTVENFISDNCYDKREGYYYIPHYEIPIKTFDKLETMMPDFLTIRSIVEGSADSIVITVLQRHFLTIGDKAMLYNSETDTYLYLIVVDGAETNERVFTCNVYNEIGDALVGIYAVGGKDMYSGDENLKNFKLFKLDNLEAPSYARILKDGTCRIIWRNIVNNGLNKSDKTVEEYPFTNGAFYVNKRIDIYLRRQDPYALYGLYSEDDIEGNDVEIENEDNYLKDEEITC